MLVYYLITFGIVMLYILFDINYFLRSLIFVSFDRLFRKRKRIFDKIIHYSFCWTTDIDVFMLQMNNVRYLRELDFARSSFYDNTGISKEIRQRGGSLMQGATCIRYRQPIRLLMPYKITTRLIYWDDKSFYLEHDFMSLTDGFLRAVALSKQTINGSTVLASEIIKHLEPGVLSLQLSEELALWIDSMDASSQRIRRKRQDSSEEKLEEYITTSFLETSPSL